MMISCVYDVDHHKKLARWWLNTWSSKYKDRSWEVYNDHPLCKSWTWSVNYFSCEVMIKVNVKSCKSMISRMIFQEIKLKIQSLLNLGS